MDTKDSRPDTRTPAQLIYDQLCFAARDLIRIGQSSKEQFTSRRAREALNHWDANRPPRPEDELSQSCNALAGSSGSARLEKEVEPRKRFHRTDTLVYEYVMISMTDPNVKQESPNIGCLSRVSKRVYASPGASWGQIFREVNQLIHTKPTAGADNPVVTTCMVDHEEFVLGLTLRGFMKVCESLPSYGTCHYDELIERVAKELVAQRDYAAYKKKFDSTPTSERFMPERKMSDFWPS